MRFSTLSNKTLLHSFQEAIRIKANPDFIHLLEVEIRERGLPKPQMLEKKLKKIN